MRKLKIERTAMIMCLIALVAGCVGGEKFVIFNAPESANFQDRNVRKIIKGCLLTPPVQRSFSLSTVNNDEGGITVIVSCNNTPSTVSLFCPANQKFQFRVLKDADVQKGNIASKNQYDLDLAYLTHGSVIVDTQEDSVSVLLMCKNVE